MSEQITETIKMNNPGTASYPYMSADTYGFAFQDASQTAFAFKASAESVVELLCTTADFKSDMGRSIDAPSFLDKDDLIIVSIPQHDWSIALPWVYSSSIAEILHDQSQELSKQLSCSVVDFYVTGTGDYCCFWHYRSGMVIDKLEKLYERARGYEEEELTTQLINYLLENEPDFIADGYFHYVNSSESVDAVIPLEQYDWDANSFAITKKFMQEQRIYVPDLGDLRLQDIDWAILRFH
ncbi:MAG: hypothetical protein HC812_08795 [Leptolyngbya sp. RL_3_1]|nr:hypothetical protein [Leptolyngbya sp. RL_3_1]